MRARVAMRMLWLPIFLVVAGCALSPEYRARYQAQVAARQEAIDQADDAHCRFLGTLPGSTAYVYCREATANNRQAADEAQRQAWLGVAQSGFQMMATPPPAPQPPPSDDHVCIAPNNTYYRCP
jgi:hypothetical protein